MLKKSKDGKIFSCSFWNDRKYCLNCPERRNCDILGKWRPKYERATFDDIFNPSRRTQN